MNDRQVRTWSWMLSAIKSGGVERFADLHIDNIDPKWKKREHWLHGGLEALRIATIERTSNKLPFDIALVYSLKAGTDPLGINFGDIETLQEEFDWSPPSLYLIKKGEKPWTCGAANGSTGPSEIRTEPLDPRLYKHEGLTATGFFMEFKPSDVIEYSRTVHIIA